MSGLFASGETALVPDAWYHVVLVRQGSSVQVFLNGDIEIEAEAAWGGGNGDHLTFGNRVDADGLHGYGMTGLIDEAAAWDRPLRVETVRSLFQAASKGPRPALKR